MYSTIYDAFRLGLGLFLLLHLIYPTSLTAEDSCVEPNFTGAKVGKIVQARITILTLCPGSTKFKIPMTISNYARRYGLLCLIQLQANRKTASFKFDIAWYKTWLLTIKPQQYF